MFIPKDYLLTAELAEKGDIHIANFSNYYNLLQDQDTFQSSQEMIKYGACTFINSKSSNIPQNFKDIINSHEFTRMDNKILNSEFISETGTSLKVLVNSLKEYNPTQVEVSGKKFTQFDDSFIELLKNKCINVLSKEETEECTKDKSIDGSIKLSTNKYLTWYNVF